LMSSLLQVKMIIFHGLFVFFFFSFWYWGLNPGHPTTWVNPQSSFCVLKW
jgi:hypothetical protein